MKPTLLTRLKMAYSVLLLKDFDWWGPFEDKTGGCPPLTNRCDNKYRTDCSTKNITKALYQKRIRFEIEYCNSYFLCESCAKNALGTEDKLLIDTSLFRKNKL